MTDLPDPGDRLDSWKEIASFLGRTVRTVQRWEKMEGLPVRRGGPGRGVVASRKEVGEWWQERGDSLQEEEEDAAPVPPASSVTATAWGLAAALAFAVVIAAVLTVGAPGVTELRQAPVIGRALATSTSEGQTFTRIQFDTAPRGLAAAPSGEYLYVALTEERSIAVVRLADLTVVRRIRLHESPEVIALSPNGRRLIAAGPTELSVVHLENDSIEVLPPGGQVRAVAFSRDGRQAWLALARSGLKILDLESGTVEARPTIGCPYAFAAAPVSGRIFVAYQCKGPGGRDGHDAIEVIDVASRSSLVARSDWPMVGSGLALSPDEQFLWADTADACSGRIYDESGCPPGRGPVLLALNAASLDPLLMIRVPSPHYQATPLFFPDGSRLLAVLDGVNVLNTSLGHVEERFDMPGVTVGIFAGAVNRFFLSSPLERSVVELPLHGKPDARTMDGIGTYWALDGTANDIVGGMHGVSESVEFLPGRLGRAAAFDGIRSSIDYSWRSDVDVLGPEATVAAWIKYEPTGSPMVVVDSRGPEPWRLSLTPEGRLSFCVNSATAALGCDGLGLVSRAVLGAAQWHHAAIVLAETRATLFVDGVPDASAELGEFRRRVRPNDLKGRVTVLGAGPRLTQSFKGLIDEVAFFHRALSATELVRLAELTTYRRQAR
ncbi:MAG TPA: LamG-like jellyroll fold domain-containing protein [Vicinamibacterales bacterium]|nr:LamG-like jellyroll fold domain-containing protein [Vicinamibacterales bacterium]